ncbi:OmpA family protein [Arenibacter sp. GZD96]|uniref:OmpA family protein n=1 Tax=Aurantibrevibacter litoralis TaxID=3106030 RepID=UPI002AFEB2C9|nr:OmpA family protein [Arenibacter sp. GZD-96]MEA1784601.1 OmpA family protein [Arenibacter sp. GZD-96]
MKFRILILLIFFSLNLGFGQEKKSKADKLYFEYAYKSAIAAYTKEQQKKPLANYQLLNLADAYIKTGDFKNAVETYLNFYKKDTLIPNHDFNKMLRALKNTSGMDRVKAFLATKRHLLSDEWIENAEFNAELLATDENAQTDLATFNLKINSAQADFSPTFYDGRLLFTSARGNGKKGTYIPSGEAYLDIYLGRIEPNGDVISAIPFDGIPQSLFHKATPFYSNEINRIFYVLSNADGDQLTYDSKGKNALAMGASDSKGSFEYLLRDLSTSFYYPFYEAATGKLYFAANFQDSYGGTDIYYVYTNNGQIMSAPVNLGPRINTPGNEIAPFLFENSLYFSSDVFYGLGGMDVYETKIQPDGSHSIPINLGFEINSDKDDFGFIIKRNTPEGLTGYFSSNRAGGKGKDDMYAFKVSEKPGLKTLVLKGSVVTPNKNEGIAKVSVQLLDAAKNVIKEIFTKENGEFQIEIPWRDTVAISIHKERHAHFSDLFLEKDLEGLQKNPMVVELALLDDLVQEKENQTVLKLGKFYFTKGKTEVTSEIAKELDKVVYAVSQFPELQLSIETHTDSRGSNAANLKLSQERSNAIKRYLTKNGVPAKNIENTVGYGEEKIINNCKNGVFCLDMLHQQNERSLIVVRNYDTLFKQP